MNVAAVVVVVIVVAVISLNVFLYNGALFSN